MLKVNRTDSGSTGLKRGSHKPHRWREMDSNFPYTGTVNLVIAPL
jgi:hypothetical protein